jgi:hypothetical protein
MKIRTSYEIILQSNRSPANLKATMERTIAKTEEEQIVLSLPLSSARKRSKLLPRTTTISCCFGPEKLPKYQDKTGTILEKQRYYREQIDEPQ